MAPRGSADSLFNKTKINILYTYDVNCRALGMLYGNLVGIRI